jgi:hypothetical protein
MVHMVMKIKFSINEYSQVFNRVGPSYGRLSKCMIIHQYLSFPGEGYNFSFTAVECHTVSSTETLFRVNDRL